MKHMADEVKACLKASYISLSPILLSQYEGPSMKGDLKAEKFLNLLIKIGSERLKEEDGKVYIPDNLCEVVADLKILCDKIYPGLNDSHLKYMNWLKESYSHV